MLYCSFLIALSNGVVVANFFVLCRKTVIAAFQSDAFLLLHVIIIDSLLKVLSFALKEGKVAVHCHAGLGRTGVLIACYLVYYLRYQENNLVLVTSL